MPRILCDLPNASDNINGIPFTADRGQMVSDVVDEATAAAFSGIPGYTILPDKPPAPQQTGGSEPAPAGGRKRAARPDATETPKAEGGDTAGEGTQGAGDGQGGGQPPQGDQG